MGVSKGERKVAVLLSFQEMIIAVGTAVTSFRFVSVYYCRSLRINRNPTNHAVNMLGKINSADFGPGEALCFTNIRIEEPLSTLARSLRSKCSFVNQRGLIVFGESVGLVHSASTPPTYPHQRLLLVHPVCSIGE